MDGVLSRPVSRQEPRDGLLREARDHTGLSRERVAAQLEPPVSAKTIERWETAGASVKPWRALQLADLYGVPVGSFYKDSEVAA